MSAQKLTHKLVSPLLLVFSAGLVGAIYESIPDRNFERLNSQSPGFTYSRSLAVLEYELIELDNATQNLKVKRDKEVEGSPAYIDLDKNIWDLERRLNSLKQDVNAMKRIGDSPTSKEFKLFETEIRDLKEILADYSRE